MLCVGIIILSYVLEDLAIVTAATLSVQEVLPVTAGLLAVFIGISTGDAGLYLLGHCARRFRGLKYRLLLIQRTKKLKPSLANKTFASLFVIRFVPGLRTVGYTLSGFLAVPFTLFLTAVILATALWTGIVFGSFYQLGSVLWVKQIGLGWFLIPLGVGVMWLLNRMFSKTANRGLHD